MNTAQSFCPVDVTTFHSSDVSPLAAVAGYETEINWFILGAVSRPRVHPLSHHFTVLTEKVSQVPAGSTQQLIIITRRAYGEVSPTKRATQ